MTRRILHFYSSTQDKENPHRRSGYLTQSPRHPRIVRADVPNITPFLVGKRAIWRIPHTKLRMSPRNCVGRTLTDKWAPCQRNRRRQHGRRVAGGGGGKTSSDKIRPFSQGRSPRPSHRGDGASSSSRPTQARPAWWARGRRHKSPCRYTSIPSPGCRRWLRRLRRS